MADPIKQWANAKLGKKPPGKGPPFGGGPPKPPGSPLPGGSPMGAHPGAPSSPHGAPPPGAHPPQPSAAPKQVPDIRVDQLNWLQPEQQAELQGQEPDPSPSWIDPQKWEQAKVQIGQAWLTLAEPRAVAAFFVHQAEQTAKAAMQPLPGGAPPGVPPLPHGAPPFPPKGP